MAVTLRDVTVTDDAVARRLREINVRDCAMPGATIARGVQRGWACTWAIIAARERNPGMRASTHTVCAACEEAVRAAEVAVAIEQGDPNRGMMGMRPFVTYVESVTGLRWTGAGWTKGGA